MDKFLYLPLSIVYCVFIFVVDISDPRFIVMFAGATVILGIARYFAFGFSGRKFSPLEFLASMACSFGMAILLGLGTAAAIGEDKITMVQALLAGALGALGGRELMNVIQFVSLKWGANKIGVELTDEKIEELRHQTPVKKSKKNAD